MKFLEYFDKKSIVYSIPITLLTFFTLLTILTMGDTALVIMFKSYFYLSLLFASALISRFIMHKITTGDWNIMVFRLVMDSIIIFFAVYLINLLMSFVL